MSSSNTTNICMHACYFALWCVRVHPCSFRKMNENRKRKWPKRQQTLPLYEWSLRLQSVARYTLGKRCTAILWRQHFTFNAFWPLFLILFVDRLIPYLITFLLISQWDEYANVSISFTTQSSWLFKSKSQLNFDYLNLICFFPLIHYRMKKKTPKRNQSINKLISYRQRDFNFFPF